MSGDCNLELNLNDFYLSWEFFPKLLESKSKFKCYKLSGNYLIPPWVNYYIFSENFAKLFSGKYIDK